jgi:hypothetical protein
MVGLSDGKAVAPDEGCVAMHRVRVVDGRVCLLIEPGAQEQVA